MEFTSSSPIYSFPCDVVVVVFFFPLNIIYTIGKPSAFLFQQLCVEKESVLVGIIVINNNMKNIHCRTGMYNSNDSFSVWTELNKKDRQKQCGTTEQNWNPYRKQPFLSGVQKKHTPYFNFKVKSDSKEKREKKEAKRKSLSFTVLPIQFLVCIFSQTNIGTIIIFNNMFCSWDEFPQIQDSKKSLFKKKIKV